MSVKFDPDRVIDQIRTAANIGVMNGAEMVREEALRSITQDPKTGRKYPGLPNRSSAPGESPASQLGRLVASIETRPDPANVRAVVNAGTAYARILEMGTGRMAPRPFLRPALALKREEIEAEINARIRAALNG